MYNELCQAIQTVTENEMPATPYYVTASMFCLDKAFYQRPKRQACTPIS